MAAARDRVLGAVGQERAEEAIAEEVRGDAAHNGDLAVVLHVSGEAVVHKDGHNVVDSAEGGP